MPEEVLFPQYRDQLGPTGYPFEPGATLRNAAGDVLPAGFLLDAAVYPVGGREGAYVSAVSVGGGRVTFTTGDAGTASRASGWFEPDSPPDRVALRDAYGRPAGLLVSEPERLAAFGTWAAGEHAFTRAAAGFVAGVCFPSPSAGVEGFLLDDGSLVTGDVCLMGADGVILTASAGTDPAAGPAAVVRVDAVGEPLWLRKVCGGGGFESPRFVRRVRVVGGPQTFDLTPDAYGFLRLTVGDAQAEDTVLRLRTTPTGLVFEVAAGSLGDGP